MTRRCFSSTSRPTGWIRPAGRRCSSSSGGSGLSSEFLSSSPPTCSARSSRSATRSSRSTVGGCCGTPPLPPSPSTARCLPLRSRRVLMPSPHASRSTDITSPSTTALCCSTCQARTCTTSSAISSSISACVSTGSSSAGIAWRSFSPTRRRTARRGSRGGIVARGPMGEAGTQPAGTAGTAGTEGAQPAGVIHDIGYRGYDGPRLGRAYAIQSLFTQSLRGAWGIGRGAKAKLVPIGMLALVLLPALVWSAVGNQLNRRLVEYVDFPITLQMPIIIFLAAQSVELLSRDLRFTVLPLYFSRPLRRDDYVWAKLAAMTAALAMLMIAPIVLAYLVAAFDGNNDTTVWDETTAAFGGVLASVLYAVVLAALALVIAAFAAKRVYTIGAIVALFVISSVFSGIVEGLSENETSELAGLLTPFRLLAGTFAWLRGQQPELSNTGGSRWLYGLTTAALLALCVGLLLARYRRVGRC